MNAFLHRVLAPFLAIAILPGVVPSAEVSYAQIRALALEGLRSGDVPFAPPCAKPVRGILWAKDVGPGSASEAQFWLDYWFDAGEPAKAALVDQLGIEIRRQYLFKRESNRRIMDPYYVRMDEIVAA